MKKNVTILAIVWMFIMVSGYILASIQSSTFLPFDWSSDTKDVAVGVGLIVTIGTGAGICAITIKTNN